MSRTLLRNTIFDHSDALGAAPACRRCSNYIFILDLTPGSSGLGNDNCKTTQETFKFLWFGVSYIRDLTVCIIPNRNNDTGVGGTKDNLINQYAITTIMQTPMVLLLIKFNVVYDGIIMNIMTVLLSLPNVDNNAYYR